MSNYLSCHRITFSIDCMFLVAVGPEQCLAECEGHQWEVAPYFEPSPNGISYCYRNQDQLIVCKEDPASGIILSPGQLMSQSLVTYGTSDVTTTGEFA